MVATSKQRGSEARGAAKNRPPLPPRLRILCITTRRRTGAWLTEALSADRSVKIELEEALGTAAGLARLRDQVFDAVLVSHLPGELDAVDLVEGYRAGGAEEPILILGSQSEQEMAPLCYEAGADGYLCVHTATMRNLMWVLARAIQRHQLLREYQYLKSAEQSRLEREHDEAQRLIKQQRAVIGDGNGDCPNFRVNNGDCPDFRVNENGTVPFGTTSVTENGTVPVAPPLPPELCAHFRDLLRTYVIMGSGNLGDELKRLAELLIRSGLSARQTIDLHLKVVQELLEGLGARSTRHVMTRADLLALELMVHLAGGYQRRYEERARPPEQLSLPGF